jgi:hypothetical protein
MSFMIIIIVIIIIIIKFVILVSQFLSSLAGSNINKLW